MNRKINARTVIILLLVGLLLSLIQPVQAQPNTGFTRDQLTNWDLGMSPPILATFEGDDLEKIEPQVFKELTAENTTDFYIWLSTKADLSPASALATKEEKGQFVFETLRNTAESSQRSLREILDAQGVRYRPYYISNKILVRGGNQELVTSLAARPDVARITANHSYQLEEPWQHPKALDTLLAIGPNISFVNADDVWALGFTGQGVVLAGNDTGLAWDHPAIINHYRGWNGVTVDHNYNWWDATNTYPNTPADGFGHGTHTTGTMVGDDGGTNQIGMAPGSTTVHCKNMDDFGGGWDSTFIECFEWDLAPWDLNRQNPRPDLAPDAVTNSWGYWGGGYPEFEDEIAALQAAGIFVEVSAGNEGPSCQTLRTPGDYGEVMTMGSVSHASGSLPGSLTWFSSRGPSTLTSDLLPDVMAPGENIRSSVPGGGYQSWDGTSMAGPHVTGLIGLMWAANPGLRGFVAETHQILFTTTVPLSGQSGSNCGGDYDIGPNNDWGYGTIDALGAVQAALAFGGTGTLAGTVTDSVTSNPLPGALIVANLNPDLKWQTTTDALGQYSRTVFSGTYTVTASLYGYYPAVDTGVVVISGTTTTNNIQMDPAPIYQITGQVTDATTGWPLYARLDIAGYPGEPVWTDPVTGEYSINLAAGINYTFRVTPWVDGYQIFLRPIGPLVGNQTEDFAIQVDVLACTAPGYEPDFVFFEDFEAGDGGFLTEGETSWAWGFPSSGPRSAHSGVNVWATNLAGNYFDNEFGSITSPEIDLSAYPGETVIVTWWQWLHTESFFDYASVEVTNDGGATWTTIYGPESGLIDVSWTMHSVLLDPSYAVSDFRLRFTLQTDYSITFPGFYIDDVGVGVAQPPTSLYSEDFESTDGTYISSGFNASWEWGTPSRGPGAAYSGINAWATSLGGNYNNDEDSVLLSPAIDLSGASGQTLELSWWQWLQTESSYDFASLEISNDNGTTWASAFGPVSGLINDAWSMQSVILDPAYAVSDFRLRFSLQTDSTVTYPGFYVDDVQITVYTGAPPAVACDLLAGGLVVGHVFDANTNLGLDGARVASVSDIDFTRLTPSDNALDDGFYTLFAPEGTQPLTATKSGGYTTVNLTTTVLLNDAVRQDFSLAAGLLAANPASLQATLNMGISRTLTFDLENNGGMDAQFELREKAGEFSPVQRQSVAVPDNQVLESLENTYAGQQSQKLVARTGWMYEPSVRAVFSSQTADVLLVAAADVTQIQAILLSYPEFQTVDIFDARFNTPTLASLSAYDTVVLISNSPFADPVAMGDVLADYVDGGGTVIQTVATLYDEFGFGWGLKGRFIDEGYSPFIGSGDWFTWADLGNFDGSHPIMEGVTTAGDYFRQMVDLSPGAEWVASWTDDEFIATKDSVVALNVFLPDGYAWSGDVDLIVHNSILWLLTGGDVPWISVEPITGTVTTLGSQTIQLTLDASVPEIAQPGTYNAQIRILDDSPYDADAVQITMNVDPPNGWGKLAGTIIGLEACDMPGTPLSGASIEVLGVATTESTSDGLYGYWMPAGPYTVMVTAQNYIPQTFAIDITAGEIRSQDIDLRLDAPCTSITPDTFVISVPEGSASTVSLALENTGAGTLNFNIFESFAVTPAVQGGAQRSTASNFQLVSQTGPASVLSLAARLVEGESLNAPLSGWFGARDIPGGLIRYASAQCYEEPEQFYVFAGVDGQGRLTRKSWRFDASTNTWTALADMPSGGEAPTSACFQGKIYVMGGSGTDQFYIYNIAANRWISGAPLPRGVEGAASAVWAGKVYLVGGDDDFWPGNGVSDRVDVYDIATDTWEAPGASMPTATGNAGYFQMGPHLYVVGGWGADAPEANVTATQRYDMVTNAWELGPAFTSARADFALAATGQALYAIGGDQNGNFFFEATDLVERLDIANWPAGEWVDTGDPLPGKYSANNAGFCTEILIDETIAEIWSLGGLDTNFWLIHGRAQFKETSGESCYSIYTDVPWLSENPFAGIAAGDSLASIDVTFDATQLTPGLYTATIFVLTNDLERPLINIPITLMVGIQHHIYLPIIASSQ